MRRVFRRLGAVAVASATLGVTLTAAADPAPATSSSASARRRELPELPRAPALESKDPVPADLAEIDELVERITNEDEATRDDGVRRIAELTPRLVPAIRRRLDALASKADTGAMKLLLGDIRQKLRGERDDDPNQQAAAERDKATDYLDFVLKRPRPRDSTWKNLVTALALRRMLEHLGTTPAARGIVEVYVRFGEFLRLDAQRALARLGDRAVPALLEARRHPAEKISRWATRQLDALGRLTPGQAAQIADPQILSDVFRAWGRTRDLDAARIVISFAGSERGQLREAARQAIAMFGEAGHWQLRDAYENVVGKRAPRDWTWERTARELFGELDRLRRLEVEDLFEAGQKAQASGDLDAMRKAFDEVLARSPFFERADEMVGGYWAYGTKYAEDMPNDALFALRRAERLSRGASHHDRIESLLLTLEAERLADTGVVDRNLFKRALELDPGNRRAKDALTTLSSPVARGDKKLRYSIAGGIALAGLLGVLVVLFRPRKKAEASTEPKPTIAEPKEAEPKSDELKLAEAKTVEPNAAEPNAADSKEAEPKSAEPKTET